MQPRRQDTAFEALAELHGGYRFLTSSARGRVNKALKEIREVMGDDLDSDEINRRIGNLRTHFPRITVTATALATHWALCDQPSKLKQPPTPYSIAERFTLDTNYCLSMLGV